MNIADDTTWWRITAGRGGVLEDDWLARDIVTTGWGEAAGDFREVDPDEFHENDPSSNYQLSKFIGYDSDGLEVGDIVVAYAPEKGHVSGVGRVGDINYDESMSFDFIDPDTAEEYKVDDHYYWRPVTWFDWGTPVSVSDLPERFQVHGKDQIPTPPTLNQYGTLATDRERLEALKDAIQNAEPVSGKQSRTSTESAYFILQTGDEQWEDELGEQYHFELGNPGTRQLYESDTAHVVYLEGGELYATARVTGFQEGNGNHVFADIEDYEEIEPIELNAIRSDFDTSFSMQHSIIRITEDDYHLIVDQGTEPRYFWVNCAADAWYEERETAFYTTRTDEGRPRRNQSVYERLRPGDEALIYRNSPYQAITGRGHVEEGLHEQPVGDNADETREGVTIAWDESIEEVSWSRITSEPAFQESQVVASDNSYVITELSERQFETVLEIAEGREPNHFWVTANPALWDIEATDEGRTVFYTAYNENGRKRRLFDAFKQARPGDKVLFYKSSPTQEVIGEGTAIEGFHEEQPEYREDEVEGITLRYEGPIDPVDWDTLTSLPELEGTPVLRNNARGALFPLPEDAFEAISSFGVSEGGGSELLEERVVALRDRLSPPTVSFEVPEGLYFEDEAEIKRQIEASLNSGQHIIFTGPPGTGKTKLAKHICETVVDDHGDIVDGYRFTTATAEWTTFDTIGGYVPNRSANGGELVFQPRMFLDCFREEGAVQNQWLVIDEINRSDIDKAFGQLFSVLSGDSVELPYERESPIELVSLEDAGSVSDDRLASIISNQDVFPITPSWRLLATMNTYDKTSLYELSYAFMRRFNFIHVGVPPLAEDGKVRTSLLRPDADENYATEWLADDPGLEAPLEASYQQLAVVWHKINKHQTIGPSIIRDMLGYIAATNPPTWDDLGPALTDAVIALVFPQLEGMAPQEQRSLIESLTDTDVPTEEDSVDLMLEGGRLERKAEDFFDLLPKSDD